MISIYFQNFFNNLVILALFGQSPLSGSDYNSEEFHQLSQAFKR